MRLLVDHRAAGRRGALLGLAGDALALLLDLRPGCGDRRCAASDHLPAAASPEAQSRITVTPASSHPLPVHRLSRRPRGGLGR
jgi:hypothetical protein